MKGYKVTKSQKNSIKTYFSDLKNAPGNKAKILTVSIEKGEKDVVLKVSFKRTRIDGYRVSFPKVNRESYTLNRYGKIIDFS
jgi:hypothetical protein